MNPILVLAGVAGLLAPAQVTTRPAAPTEPAIRVLLITGCDVLAHNWRETTPALRKHLEDTGRFEVVVSEEPLVLESSALGQYDVVLINYYNHERPGLTAKARDNLASFVRSGRGLVCFHFSTRAFGDWPGYRDLVGRIWTDGSGHGPRGPFEVKVVDREHPITAGMKDFKADDELYAKLVGDAPIHVLVEAKSEWSGRVEPLAWTLDYGRGRVFSFVLGHDVRAIENGDFARLLTRGTEWAAKGAVAPEKKSGAPSKTDAPKKSAEAKPADGPKQADTEKPADMPRQAAVRQEADALASSAGASE